MKKWRLLLLLFPLIAGALYLRSLASWRPQKILAETGDVLQLDFSRDGQNLLIVNHPQWSGRQPKDTRATITVLDTQNAFGMKWQLKKEFSFSLHSNSRFLARDSKILLLGYNWQTLDALTGKLLDDYGAAPVGGVLSPDEKWLAYSQFREQDKTTLEGRVYLKSAPKSQQRGNYAADKILGWKDSRSTWSFSPDGKMLVVGVGDWRSAHLDFYDVGSWKRVRTLMDRKVRSYHQSLLPGYGLMQWSPNGKYLLTSLTWDGVAHSLNLWRLRDGKKFTVDPLLEVGLKLQDDGRVLAFDNTNQGRVLLSGSLGSNSKPTTVLRLPKDYITAVDLSPDGSCLIAGTQSGSVYRKRLK